MLGSDQGAALGLPALAEGREHAVAPFTVGYQCYSAAHAVCPGAAGDFAGFVLGSQAELEQLRRTFLAAFAVVQGEGGDRQLFTAAQLADQVLFQWADHQLYAGGLGLGVEGVHRADARAVENLNIRWVLSGLLRLVVRGHEALSQRFGDGRERAFLGQQQANLGQWLAGQLLELGQWQRQLQQEGKPFRAFEYDVSLPDEKLGFIQISGKPEWREAENALNTAVFGGLLKYLRRYRYALIAPLMLQVQGADGKPRRIAAEDFDAMDDAALARLPA